MQQPRFEPKPPHKSRRAAAPSSPAPPVPVTAHGPAAATDGRRHMVYRRGEHLWTFRWDTGGEAQLIEAVTSLADGVGRPFDWVDAAVVCHCLGQTVAAPSARSMPLDDA